MRRFKLNRETPVVLYGAAAIGSIMYDALRGQGFTVTGFIDKRAGELSSYLDLPVWGLGEKPEDPEQIVILAVKNVFEHEQIVRELLRHGYERLIYKPLKVLNNCASPEERLLGDAYDAILAGAPLEELILPCTEKAVTYILKDYALLERRGESVVAKIPVEFVFTNDYRHEESKWGNVNILAFFTHTRFFRSLLGENGVSPEDYVNEYCAYSAPEHVQITEGWKNNVVRNRAMILERMDQNSELDPDFFLRNAPQAVWNEKGYFNLTSGKHRAAFFAAKGFRYIPLEVSAGDYERFLNSAAAMELYDTLERAGAPVTYPIPHPFFYCYPILSNEFYRKLTAYYTDRIAYENYYPQKEPGLGRMVVVDALADDWGVAWHFAKAGCQAGKLPPKDPAVFALLKTLSHTPELKIVSSGEELPGPVDYLFLETDDLGRAEDLLAKFRPRTLVLVFPGRGESFSVPGYSFREKAFSAYRESRFVQVLNYVREEP